MPPEPRLATIATIQQAITSLLTTYEPTFLTFGLTFFRSIAVILIVWHGIKMMFTQQTVNTPEHMFEFAKLLLFISFGYALIAYTRARFLALACPSAISSPTRRRTLPTFSTLDLSN